MADLEWSHTRRRSHGGSPNNEPVKLSALRGLSDAAWKPGEGALRLVNQAAEALRDLEDHARELESRSRFFSDGALEKLKRAEQQVQLLQDNNIAAETRIAELHDHVQELEEALKAERARVAAAERELERCTQIARERAAEFEDAVGRIEEAIRTKILKELPACARRAATG